MTHLNTAGMCSTLCSCDLLQYCMGIRMMTLSFGLFPCISPSNNYYESCSYMYNYVDLRCQDAGARTIYQSKVVSKIYVHVH